MKFAAVTTAALLMSVTFGFAQSFSDKVESALEEQGFEVLSSTSANGLIAYTATRFGKMRELVFDASTGRLLRDVYDGTLIAGLTPQNATFEVIAIIDSLTSGGLDIYNIDFTDGLLTILGDSDGESQQMTIQTANANGYSYSSGVFKNGSARAYGRSGGNGNGGGNGNNSGGNSGSGGGNSGK